MRRALEAERYVAGSRFLARSYAGAGWLPGSAPVEVVPYGIPYARPEVSPREGAPPLPLRLGFIGPLMRHKGAHVAVEAVRGMAYGRACLRLWGDPTADPAYAGRLRAAAGEADVRIEGAFDAGAAARVFAGMDVLLVPSVGLESYGIVVDEAMAHGVPVVASRGGALPERYEESCGAFVPAGDAGALREVLERLAARPETVERWRLALPKVRTLQDAARRIEEIYVELLGPGGAS
jgi:glycosyltransferase involved in cell wall biosynthesis